MSATFFDFALNHSNAAIASAVARARRDAIADGTAYRVEFMSSAGERKFWNGNRLDALALGRDLHTNGVEVVVTRPDGEEVDLEKVRY